MRGGHRRASCPTRRPAEAVEGVLQVGDEVLDVLDAAGEPDQVDRNGQFGALDRGVGHLRRVVHQGLDAAEGLGEGEHGGRFGDLAGRRLAALELHRDHAAELLHLLLGQLVAGVRGQARVQHGLHLGALQQPFGHGLGVVAVPVHPDAQGLEPAGGEEGVHRAGHGADGELHEADLLGQFGVLDHDRAAHHVGVAADVLGGGVHHDVGTQGERGLQVGRREGVVHHQEGAGVVRHLGEGLDVGDLHHRVGRRLHPHEAGLAAVGPPARRPPRRRGRTCPPGCCRCPSPPGRG